VNDTNLNFYKLRNCSYELGKSYIYYIVSKKKKKVIYKSMTSI